ncbi:MAG: ABC transporter ATP-binding protein [Acidobacteriota bacterium]
MSGDQGPLLAVSDLKVTFETREGSVEAIRGVNLTVNRGEVLALVGESGSGKTVSMLAAMGLLPPSARVSGSVRLNGRELVGLSRAGFRHLRGSEIAMIFQDPMTSLNPVLPVGLQVTEAISAHQPGLSRKARRAAALEVLDEVAIPRAAERMKSYPFEFSGGMLQRVMIAIALANDPAMLVADECTTALDVTIQAQILELLRRTQSERGIGVVLITHDLGIVAGLAGRVSVMYAGQVVEEGQVDDIFYKPRHPYTRGLLSCLPRIDRPRKAFTTIPGNPPSLINLPSGCAFHPRCPHAQDVCRTISPELLSHNGASVACHLSEELSLLETENSS